MASGCAFFDFSEMRAIARRRLPRALFDYIDRGTEAETALGALRDGFDRCRIAHRALRDVSRVDTSVELFGERRARPFVIAPTALAGLVRHDGEVLMARAAARAGVPFCVATQSSTSVERIAEAADGAELWFQLYVWRDHDETWKLLERVRALGISKLLLTVDTPASPKKVHNRRNGFAIPLRPNLRLALDLMAHPGWTLGVMGRYWLSGGLPSYDNYPGAARGAITQAIADPRFALETRLDAGLLAEVRQRWPGELLVKGLMHPQDARAAFTAGADGVVISCHGGRNLDSAAAPLHILPAVRAAVGPDALILADGGVRRGSDAAKLIGAGADAVLLGRAPLWGLAAGGEGGVVHALEMLGEELEAFLAFSGAADLAGLRDAEWCRTDS